MQCNVIQCNTMQCNVMQCNAMQCNAHSKILHTAMHFALQYTLETVSHKNYLISGIAQISSPPLPPIRATWSSFFWRQKGVLRVWQKKSTDDGCNYDCDSNDDNLGDNYDKNGQKIYIYYEFWVKMYQSLLKKANKFGQEPFLLRMRECTFSHPQQGWIDFNTANPSLPTEMDFLIHSCW